MKKLILSLAMLAAGAAAFAQKPAAGGITLETQINLQVGTSPISLFTPNVRARYFLNEGLAARVQFLFANTSETDNFAENPDGTGASGERVIKTSNFNIGLGAEKHFAGTEKLSPYVGALLTIGLDGAKEEWTNYNGAGYAANTTATVDGGSGFNPGPPPSVANSAGTTIGFQLLAGADYYIVPNVYIGGEFGWGFTTTSTKDVEITLKANNTETKTKLLGRSENEFAIGTAAIRLGILF
jgi:hypothetical protein